MIDEGNTAHVEGIKAATRAIGHPLADGPPREQAERAVGAYIERLEELGFVVIPRKPTNRMLRDADSTVRGTVDAAKHPLPTPGREKGRNKSRFAAIIEAGREVFRQVPL
jgi:hypothetical protein